VFESEHPHDTVEWIDPAYGFARYLRGVALADLGRLEEAEQELERAIEWDPVSDRSHLELGWVAAQRGHHREGAVAYARAAELYRAGDARLAAQALRGRGYCLAALGLEDEALAAYRDALVLEPTSEVARDAVAGLEGREEAAPAPGSEETARLLAGTLSGAIEWKGAAAAGAADRAFSCRERGRDVTISRHGRRYRLVVRGATGETTEEEQDGLLRRSRKLKPLFGVVSRRTRVLER